jgi:hypothetical protein
MLANLHVTLHETIENATAHAFNPPYVNENVRVTGSMEVSLVRVDGLL